MNRSFTRRELYELVWSSPRTALAKQFGVSDVWIGKQCKAAFVPMPPPGYWARVQMGKSGKRPELPIRFPGSPREVVVGESSPVRHWGSTEPLTEPGDPPDFDESIDAQVEGALSALGKLVSKRDLSDPHKGLSRILGREAKRRAKYADRGWSFDRPLFDDATHQRQLRFFNNLCWYFDRIHVAGEVFTDDQWIQGVGTTHRVRLRLNFGSASLDLRFLEPSSSTRVLGEKAPETTTIRVEQGAQGVPPEQWCDQVGSRLEQQVQAIVRGLLYAAERTLRQDSLSRHQWRVERYQEHLKKLESQRLESERRRLLDIEARKQKMNDAIVALARDARVTSEIRLLVSTLQEHPDLKLGQSSRFEAWRLEALALADTLDPMKRSLDGLIGEEGKPA